MNILVLAVMLANLAAQIAPATVAATSENIALDDNGGTVESLTGEDGLGLDGRRLIDGRREPAWSWQGSALRDLPLDMVFSFYKRQPALISAVVIEPPAADPSGKPNADAPKDVEIWTSMDSPDAGFARVGAAALVPASSAQTVAFPPIEARYVKVRVRSLQGPLWALSKVGIAEIRVLEAQRGGYTALLARHTEISEWRNSPRRAAQRGIDWLQPAAAAWQKNNNCFGCHIQAQAVMGLSIAKKNDYRVNDRVLKDLTVFTESQQQPDGSYIREDHEPSTQFAAMALSYWDDLQSLAPNPRLIKSVDWLLAKQHRDGALQYGALTCGNTHAVIQGPMMTTSNSLVAFERAFIETRDPRYKAAATRARNWIASANPITTQDEVFKVLALARLGGQEHQPLVQKIVEQLVREQHPAGGWRQCNDSSTADPNPFSTGQVLYAFKQAGVSPLPKDPCALLTAADVQALDPNAKIGSGVVTENGPVGAQCQYKWGPRTPEWGQTILAVNVVDASQVFPGSLSANDIKQRVLVEVKIGGPDAAEIPGIGDGAVFTTNPKTHDATAKAYVLKAKGVLLEVTFHGGHALAQKDKLIALLKTAAAAL